MSRERRRTRRHSAVRGAAALVVAGLVATTLTGCFGWAGYQGENAAGQGENAAGQGENASGKGDPSAAVGAQDVVLPEAGDCWYQDDAVAEYRGLWWAGPPPVACDEPHATITTGVFDVDVVGPGFEYPADPYSEFPPEFYDQEELVTFEFTCAKSARARIGLGEGSRVHPRWYVPSPEEWAAGERWLRCDVAVLAMGPFDWGQIELLPATLDEVVSRASTEYRLCLDTPHPPHDAGPWFYADEAELVPCDGQSQWEFGTVVRFGEEVYPGWDEVLAESTAVCDAVLAKHPDRTSTVVLAPALTEWTVGMREATCWLL